MSTATLHIGDASTVLRTLPSGSANCVITSSPYLAKRRYLPETHPSAALELGQEPSPADYLRAMLIVADELHRVLTDDGVLWWNLGDTASGSGGAGGDYTTGGWRDGQPVYRANRGGVHPDRRGRGARRGGADGWPLNKSVCWIPELFGASLAYGRNVLTGEPCQQWITRPSVVWCKPAPTPGEILDKFREATELVVFAVKQPRYWFDLDAVRRDRSGPPLTWQVIHNPGLPARITGGLDHRHFAVMPDELVSLLLRASCPPGGTVLDPFAGTGTVLEVAVGHGRNAVGIDLDPRNEELVRRRVGLFLDAVHHEEAIGA